LNPIAPAAPPCLRCRPFAAAAQEHDLEQLTIAEAAARLGVTPEAVKSRLHRARALVREYLA
jgi:DNA-directed RNA polymerase specialized sigma24 family protein